MASNMDNEVEVEKSQPEMADPQSTDSESGATRGSEDGSSSSTLEGDGRNSVTNHYHVHTDEFNFKSFHQHHSEMTVTYVHHHHHHYYFCQCSLRQASTQEGQNAEPDRGESGSVGKDVTARVGSCAGMQPEDLLENPVESPVRMLSRPEGDCSSPVPKLRRLNASQFGATSANGRHWYHHHSEVIYGNRTLFQWWIVRAPLLPFEALWGILEISRYVMRYLRLRCSQCLCPTCCILQLRWQQRFCQT